MKNVLIFILLLFSTHLIAKDKVDVRLSPEKPVLGENFYVMFDIYTESEVEPKMTFDPFGLEVISQSPASVSTRTTYVNGQLTVEKKYIFTYEMIAKRAGLVYLKNIKVDIEGKKLTHSGVQISVLTAPARAKDLFVKADVETLDAVVGQSLVVRYYLYSRTNVSNIDIQKFPKLENFLKRFHQESANPERVSEGGQIYTRRVFYTVQLFPNKPGKLKIDPIEFGVTYSKSSNDPFGGLGGFGLSFSRPQKTTLRSQTLEVNVIPIPTEGMPKGFTGLVGNHELEFKLNREKFIVNEPMEIKFKISGSGALELYDPEAIFGNTQLEEFETTSDLNVRPDFTASKSFEMTYLARQPGIIEKREISFSFYDPGSKKFINKTITIPQITIIAGANTQAKSDGKKSASKEAINKEDSNPGISLPKAPVFTPEDFKPIYSFTNSYIYFVDNINIALIALIFIVLGLGPLGLLIVFVKTKAKNITTFHYKNLSYGDLYTMLNKLSEKGSISDKIQSSQLSSEAKQHFSSLVNLCEKEYQINGKANKVHVNRKFYKEFQKILALNEGS